MTDIVQTASTAVVPTPAHMLQAAIEKGASMEQLEKLLDLQERWEANQARKAYVAAMAAFKSEPLTVLKSKQVSIPGGAKFSHATLADVVDAVALGLGRHGLSHRWDVMQAGGTITVSCIITHELGHSERTTLVGQPDDSGRKNGIQQVASTVTYLQRYTLMAATGLAAKDMDDDGRGAGKPPAPEVQAPAGYENWKADMRAKADEGSEALQAAWKATSDDTRRFVVKHDDAWWQDTKAKASRAKVAA